MCINFLCSRTPIGDDCDKVEHKCKDCEYYNCESCEYDCKGENDEYRTAGQDRMAQQGILCKQ